MGRRNSISEAWAARSIEMLESPAYRVLSLSAHRILSRIEVEFAHHAGKDNGQLPVTFDDFAEYGVHRMAIGPALEELEALGFIEITAHGKPAEAAEYRRPNKFMLMSRPKMKGSENKCGWRRFSSLEEAEFAATAARKNAARKSKERRSRDGKKKKAASTENVPKAGTENVL
jgi:DNA-binding transcriptional MocR family regulator